jgi:hypothetical protein
MTPSPNIYPPPAVEPAPVATTAPATVQPAPSTPPVLPYAVELFPYGTGRLMETKVSAGRGGGELLSDDERAVWAYVKWLEAENSRLAGEVAAAREVAKGKGGKK